MTELSCADVEARFVDAVDARLDPAESVRFHSHIEGCPTCRERAALWRGLVPALRAPTPPLPDAMATRRMQLEIERQLAAGTRPSPPRRWRAWWVPALGLCAASAIVVLSWRSGSKPPPEIAVGYAAITSTRGAVSVGDRSPALGMRIPVNAPVVLGADAAVQVSMDGGATIRLSGPARLRLDGSPGDVAIRLAVGRLDAEVAHRAPDERFVVITGDVKVVVRGTKFSVSTAAGSSRVEVAEGRVAVERAGRTMTIVAAGERFDSGPAGPPPEASQVPTAGPPIDCGDSARSCRTTARAVRASMRVGDAGRALRMITEARHARGAGDDRCNGSGRACDDELRYLNAEALNQAGRLDEAVAAYHALDGKGAPSAMRQNALFAAGQIEKRRGRLAAAGADFERALAAAPHGALHEESLVGAMESAGGTGDASRARQFARRYLEEFPGGLASRTARSLIGHGTRP